MDIAQFGSALILGLIEGLTEFLPVSSTAHILLAGELIGFHNPGKTFEVMIQLGAILAVLFLYGRKIYSLVTALPTDPDARYFTYGVIAAFLPAAVIGAIAHDFIKDVLFESPRAIAITLIVGGVLLLIIDRLPLKMKYREPYTLPIPVYVGIGFFQCLAMMPGVSRSGSSIAGALLLGVQKRAAAEFSFWLAMPTMLGAFTLDLYKNRGAFDSNQTTLIIVGFVAAFLMAILVVRRLVDFVGRHGFTPFAIWRIAVGAVALVLLGFPAPA
jgi:undecaprenyl-diphosphatase